jgi:DNA-binding YbaB/EbfC family protein
MPGIDIHHLMRQARKVEKAVQDAKETLGDVVVEGEAGGGLVKVKMDGRCNVLRIEIDQKILEPFGSAERRAEAQPEQKIDPNDKTMLEDLVAAAVNAAGEKARAAAHEHIHKATGGIQVPGLPF